MTFKPALITDLLDRVKLLVDQLCTTVITPQTIKAITQVNKDTIIPILVPLEQAYESNGGKSPYRISDVRFNQYVKYLCALAKFKDEVKLTYTDPYGKLL